MTPENLSAEVDAIYEPLWNVVSDAREKLNGKHDASVADIIALNAVMKTMRMALICTVGGLNQENYSDEKFDEYSKRAGAVVMEATLSFLGATAKNIQIIKVVNGIPGQGNENKKDTE